VITLLVDQHPGAAVVEAMGPIMFLPDGRCFLYGVTSVVPMPTNWTMQRDVEVEYSAIICWADTDDPSSVYTMSSTESRPMV
jgi:hypothetical protein